MPETKQPRSFGGLVGGFEICRECSVKVLKFRNKLATLRMMKRLKLRDLADMAGIDRDRMEDIYEGSHAPNAADVLRIMRGLEITFEPEDFEEYGL